MRVGQSDTIVKTRPSQFVTKQRLDGEKQDANRLLKALVINDTAVTSLHTMALGSPSTPAPTMAVIL